MNREEKADKDGAAEVEQVRKMINGVRRAAGLPEIGIAELRCDNIDCVAIAIAQAGGLKRAANRVDVRKSTVRRWLRHGFGGLPLEMAMEISRA